MTDPDGETLSALLRRYQAAGEPLSCEPVAHGLLNRGYRLATTRGRFFLKHHLDGDRAAIARHHRVTWRLGALGLPVAPPLADADGDTVAVVGGRAYALHPWVDGRHRDGDQLTASQSFRLGELLGRVHTCLERVIEPRAEPRTALRAATGPPGAAAARSDRTGGGGPVPAVPGAGGPPGLYVLCDGRETGRETGRESGRETGRGTAADTCPAAGPGTGPDPLRAAVAPPRGEPRRPGSGRPEGEGGYAPVGAADPEHTFAVIDALLALARRHRPRDAFDELAEHRLIERRALLERHAHRRPEAGAVPATGWVHGDFHPLNLLYRDTERDTEPAAIVDWDRLGVQPRAEEAVRAAAIFFLRPGGPLELAKVRSYARAYRRATGAGPGELAAAAHRVWWERLNDFWMLRWRYQLGDRRTDPQFPATAALAVWWTREYERVRDAFCD
ncbi:phosphotransferase [Streptomyces sp. B1866]|nr:phosphotransferase [Streptomyces sp. B1866]